MSQYLVPGLLWFAAIGCGVMAGVYFTFSTFVMTALGRIDQAAGIAAMNTINVVILRSPFMPLFFATTLVAAGLAVTALARWGEPGSTALLVGGASYVVGMFAVTVARNVPLNEALAAAALAGDGAAVWPHYLRDWTLWNHVRTVASLAATALFIVGLAAG